MMAASATLGIERLKSLFTYLQELARVRTPPVVDVGAYEWSLPLAADSSAPGMTISRRGAGFALRVQRPADAEAAEGDVFGQLFALWSKLSREAEKYQLFVADGILELAGPEGRVRHPLLLQRLEMTFDAEAPAFTLADSEDPPRLYAPLLRHVAVDGKRLLEEQRRFVEAPCHPLDDAAAALFERLVHAFWPDGTFGTAEQAGAAAGPVIYRKPAIYLGRRAHDFAGSIDRYLATLDAGDVPEALLRVVGVADDVAAPGDGSLADSDLLLTRPANREQKQVLGRLQDTGAVLVQGPPGTGKSHTIANLIGHLLAQNKTILVTSHTTKALRVVREQVAEPLRSLCVSVLDSDSDGARQLEESITGILNYLASTNPRDLDGDIDDLARKRADLARRADAARDAITAALEIEGGEVEVAGETLTPGRLAERVAGARDADWLPGPVGDEALPLSADEVAELYRLSAEIRSADAGDALGEPAPDLTILPAPAQFSAHGDRLHRARQGLDPHAAAVWRHEQHDDASLARAGELAAAAGAALGDAGAWLGDCVAAGCRGGSEGDSWRELAAHIRDTARAVAERAAPIAAHGPVVNPAPLMALGQARPDGWAGVALEAAGEIRAHLAAGKKLGRMATMFKSSWQALLTAATVDGAQPSAPHHFEALHAWLEVAQLRLALARRWDRQMTPRGAPASAQLGPEPELAAQPFAERIERGLAWADEHLRPCERIFDDIGLDWPTVVAQCRVGSGAPHDIQAYRHLMAIKVPSLIDARRKQLTVADLEAERERWLAHLGELCAAHPEARNAAALARAIRDGNRAAYASGYQRAARSVDASPGLARRDQLLAAIEGLAPAWARAIRDGDGVHAAAEPPGDAAAAWQHRQRVQRLDAILDVDLAALQDELDALTAELIEVTGRYVEAMAWRAQLGRTGLSEQQALAGWLALHKKIGKGTGKNAARLKEQAQKTLAECRQAVPVWIMPLSRVVDSFDLATTRFDVVIIDEASQCDVVGLVAFALGKEIAVVGDHEQVSPYAVGHKTEKVQALIDELLADIPNSQLYDGKTSVYDLARQSFRGTIRLLEHFRCVPDIIRFSNQLAYGGEIRALREASSARVRPALVAHKVDGTAKDKVNAAEAEEIAALVEAMCAMPEYDGLTMGVICMVGTEQALHVDSLLRRRLSADEYQRRRLLCGNASQFQGDERDVILLSLVHAGGGKRKLAIVARDDAKKSFNVAASRARDQLWVVHSLEPDRDLKDGDLRLELIQHAQRAEEAPARLERTPTELERRIFADLRKRNYNASLHGAVGVYPIDIVVHGDTGRRVAVMCDGDRLQDGAEVAEAVERQATLRRLGWTVVRVRASEYFARPGKAIQRLMIALKKSGVDAAPYNLAIARAKPDDAATLKDRVLDRARAIRAERERGKPTRLHPRAESV